MGGAIKNFSRQASGSILVDDNERSKDWKVDGHMAYYNRAGNCSQAQRSFLNHSRTFMSESPILLMTTCRTSPDDTCIPNSLLTTAEDLKANSKI
jgi:hypothetical protein